MAHGNKVVWVLIDGIGDVGVNELQTKTPLMAATTPHLDALAASGLNGVLDPVEPGLACGSDTAHLSMFGYDPKVYYRGRGAFESLGAGLTMKPGEIAFKCNFASMNTETGVVTHRRADRNFEKEGPILSKYLDNTALPSFPQHEVRVKYATEHRCGVVIKGEGLCDRISSTDPLRDNLLLLEAAPLDESKEAVHTAAVVNEVSQLFQSMLAEHPINIKRRVEGKIPANCVLLRGCGERLEVEGFHKRHYMNACMVAPTKVIAGIGMSLGIDVIEVPECTGDYHTNLSAKAVAIVEALSNSDYQLGFLHIKAIDDAGHDGNLKLKYNILAAVDVMLGQLIGKLWKLEKQGIAKFSVCCTGDHSTPLVVKDHSHEPVPFCVSYVGDVIKVLGEQTLDRLLQAPVKLPFVDCNDRVLDYQTLNYKQSIGDAVKRFDEISVAEGCLGRFPGREILPILRSFIESST